MYMEFLHYLKNCNKKSMLHTAKYMHQILSLSNDAYEEIFKEIDSKQFDIEFVQNGALKIATSEVQRADIYETYLIKKQRGTNTSKTNTNKCIENT